MSTEQGQEIPPCPICGGHHLPSPLTHECYEIANALIEVADRERALVEALRAYKRHYDKHYQLPATLKASSEIYPSAERKLFAALVAAQQGEADG